MNLYTNWHSPTLNDLINASNTSSNNISPSNSLVYQEGAISTPGSGDMTDDPGGEVVDYGTMIAESVFLGDMPFKEIINGITEQFEDYIGTEDETNYVDMFYNQMDESINAVNTDVEEDHPQEIKEVLDKLKDEFVATISDLFESRLTISIMTVDDEATIEDEVEYTIRRAYEYFILGARENFKTVISKSMIPRLGFVPDDQDDIFFAKIDDLLMDYDPLIKCLTPTEFIQLTGNDEILSMYDDNQLVGNFLRKYSAKLYKHEEFKIDIINNIIVIQNLKEDMIHGEQPTATN